MSEHKNLTGADLHESKGVATASSNTGYFADGAGSGTWKKVGLSNIDTSSIKTTNNRIVYSVLPDVSSAGGRVIPITETCYLDRLTFCLDGPITVADSNLTVYKNGVTVLATKVIAYLGSVQGTTFTVTAGANSLVDGDYLLVYSDGGSTTAAPLIVAAKLVVT